MKDEKATSNLNLRERRREIQIRICLLHPVLIICSLSILISVVYLIGHFDPPNELFFALFVCLYVCDNDPTARTDKYFALKDIYLKQTFV